MTATQKCIISQKLRSKKPYMDNDTLVVDEITELYDMLKRFDICASHAPVRKYKLDSYPTTDIPSCFPEYNTGVLVYNSPSSTQVGDLFQEWQKWYGTFADKGITVDQPSFRKAAYGTDVSMATLPPEYNCRTVKNGYVQEKVKIVHGTNKELQKVAKKLNKKAGEPRIFVSEGGRCFSVRYQAAWSCRSYLFIEEVINSLIQDGVRTTLKKGLQRL
ncbi:hypothetical protein [Halobacterium salinarum]|uniref:hypothetical protein n=1 Tax=Halobacterium salinarum TaxID=2242 RepID=UPI002556A48F|nr:hypothetical protein [Halobacterium salinarum]MDL0145044.1 hypothetical protein [Halobacterium salinarum]